MPAKEKVNLAQLRVGILAIVALACVTMIVFLLTGNASWFKKQLTYHLYTSDASGLNPGAPVRINGIQAGQVRKVELSGMTDPKRVIKIDFVIDENMQRYLPSDSLASISSDNLLGSTKFLQINEGTKPTLLQPGSNINAVDTRQFDQLIQQGYGVLDSLQGILAKVQDIVGQVEVGKGTIGKLLVDETLYNSLQSTVAEVQTLATSLNTKKGVIGHLVNDDALFTQIQGIVARIDSLTIDLQNGKGTAGKFLTDEALYRQVTETVNQTNQLLAKVNNGQGTVGKLMNDPKIANQLSDSLTKVNLVLDKLNAGQGTMGQLLVNPQLYDQANSTTRELHDVLRDFRANPKKFLSIKLKLF